MKTLTNLEISRQDYVDDAIFKLIQGVNPTKQPIEWNIEMIGDIRDAVENWMVTRLKICAEREFYPFIEEQNGN